MQSILKRGLLQYNLTDAEYTTFHRPRTEDNLYFKFNVSHHFHTFNPSYITISCML